MYLGFMTKTHQAELGNYQACLPVQTCANSFHPHHNPRRRRHSHRWRKGGTRWLRNASKKYEMADLRFNPRCWTQNHFFSNLHHPLYRKGKGSHVTQESVHRDLGLYHGSCMQGACQKHKEPRSQRIFFNGSHLGLMLTQHFLCFCLQ